MTFDFLNLTAELERSHSPRVAIRKVALSDGWPLFEATRNPLFNKHLMWPQPSVNGEALERVDRMIDAVEQGRMSAISVVARLTGEWIGLFRYIPYMDTDDTVEVGFWTRDKFWVGGYGTEVGMLCANAAFRHTAVQRIVAAASPNNRSATRNLAFCGMRPEGFVERQTEDGRSVRLQEFVLTREDWNVVDKGKNIFDFHTRNQSVAQTSHPVAANAVIRPAMLESSRAAH